jgi:hypothetical protein
VVVSVSFNLDVRHVITTMDAASRGSFSPLGEQQAPAWGNHLVSRPTPPLLKYHVLNMRLDFQDIKFRSGSMVKSGREISGKHCWGKEPYRRLTCGNFEKRVNTCSK